MLTLASIRLLAETWNLMSRSRWRIENSLTSSPLSSTLVSPPASVYFLHCNDFSILFTSASPRDEEGSQKCVIVTTVMFQWCLQVPTGILITSVSDIMNWSTESILSSEDTDAVRISERLIFIQGNSWRINVWVTAGCPRSCKSSEEQLLHALKPALSQNVLLGSETHSSSCELLPLSQDVTED